MIKEELKLKNIEHDTVHQRFEAKYIISEITAAAIKKFIEPYMMYDKHSGGKPYVINSCYLDSADMRLYYSSSYGEKNRYKLRIRSYSEDPGQPIFFEIKRRVNGIILKQRAKTSKEVAKKVLIGETVSDDELQHLDEKGLHNFYEFREMMESINAGPKVMVRYLRDAYVSTFDDPVRITFDTNLAGLPSLHYDDNIWIYDNRWFTAPNVPVILEIKFTDTFPIWVNHLVQYFHLPRTSFAKYIVCVDTLSEVGISLF